MQEVSCRHIGRVLDLELTTFPCRKNGHPANKKTRCVLLNRIVGNFRGDETWNCILYSRCILKSVVMSMSHKQGTEVLDRQALQSKCLMLMEKAGLESDEKCHTPALCRMSQLKLHHSLRSYKFCRASETEP